MRVHIELDNSDPNDAAALDRLFSAPKETPPVTVIQHGGHTQTWSLPEVPAAKKATPPPTRPKPVKEEPDEDPIAGGPDLREQAVQKATELVTSGKSAVVREALGSLGAKRVSDLADDQLEAFLSAVA